MKNSMLALLPDDYKLDFILRGLFLQHLPIDVCSHLLRKKVSDLRALALLADKLYQSRVSPSSVNLLTNNFGESLQVNLVSSSPRTLKTPYPVKIPLFKRYPTPAPMTRTPTPSGLCWFHKKHSEKANNCRKPFSFLGNE